jgi:glycerol-3-phosphate cytidylyltransferase
MKRLYTGGTFDLFHYGHVSFLKKCKMIADHVTVALNTDEFVLSYKGQKPVLSFVERELSLKSSGLVDSVISNFGGHDSKPAILLASPDILAVGDDWAHKDYFKQMQFTEEWLEENEIVLVYLTYTKTISSSEIKARIKNA